MTTGATTTSVGEALARPPVNEKLARYRASFHEQMTPRYYVGELHLAGTVTLSLAVIAGCIALLDNVGAWEWLALPVALVYANLVEYFGHRYPMHRRMPGLGLIFRRHSAQHHRFFTDADMSFDTSRDFKAVLFPLALIAFYFIGIGLPTFLVVGALFSHNVALLFIATAVAYYLNYELLHFAYHSRPDSWLRAVPGFATLRRLHTRHHDPRLMLDYNFNITYPLGDWLFGTLYRPNQDR